MQRTLVVAAVATSLGTPSARTSQAIWMAEVLEPECLADHDESLSFVREHADLDVGDAPGPSWP